LLFRGALIIPVLLLAGCMFSIDRVADAGIVVNNPDAAVAGDDLAHEPPASPDLTPLTTPPVDLALPLDLAIPPVADLAMVSVAPPDLAGAACLASCGSSCQPCCVDSCGTTQACNQACAKGCSCQIACTLATSCASSCGNGSSCGVTASSATTATMDCASGASCDVTCDSVTTCQLTCHSGAHCRLRCDNVPILGGVCDIAGCVPTTCPDGSKVCGTSC
jgi:hypothetical protein